jgi:small-conductance mechanosensitive channel/CRP-like cAMP-binding protein
VPSAVWSHPLVLGIAALAVTFAFRAFTANRLVRSKLRVSLATFILYVAVAVVSAAGPVAPDLIVRIQSVANLLLALGLITLAVVLTVNPWRVDRTPEHFPNIVQDAIIIGIFLVVGTSVMQEKFLTTSAVGAVVIGFALQDTLGNTFAGLALQVEKPFRSGHWIKVGQFEGMVAAITWRATRLRTKNGDLVTVPNSIVSKEAITNYSEPAAPTRLQIEVGVSYSTPPNEVKAVILSALTDATLVLKLPEPELLVADFAASAIIYRIKFWIDDFAADDRARDQVRTCVYYAFRRHHIEIPFPIQVQYRARPAAVDATSLDERALSLAAVPIFAPLSPAERAELAAVSRERIYGQGQTVVRQDQPGESMFVIAGGQVRVTIGENGTEVATIPAGGFFGEMSLLTGEPRTATVSAVSDCLLLEIGAQDFRRIALAHPAVVESIGTAVAERRLGLERTRQQSASSVAVEEMPRTFLARVKEFLKLS